MKNRKWVIIIIILSIMVLCLGGFICYQNFFENKKDNLLTTGDTIKEYFPLIDRNNEEERVVYTNVSLMLDLIMVYDIGYTNYECAALNTKIFAWNTTDLFKEEANAGEIFYALTRSSSLSPSFVVVHGSYSFDSLITKNSEYYRAFKQTFPNVELRKFTGEIYETEMEAVAKNGYTDVGKNKYDSSEEYYILTSDGDGCGYVNQFYEITGINKQNDYYLVNVKIYDNYASSEYEGIIKVKVINDYFVQYDSFEIKEIDEK